MGGPPGRLRVAKIAPYAGPSRRSSPPVGRPALPVLRQRPRRPRTNRDVSGREKKKKKSRSKGHSPRPASSGLLQPRQAIGGSSRTRFAQKKSSTNRRAADREPRGRGRPAGGVPCSACPPRGSSALFPVRVARLWGARPGPRMSLKKVLRPDRARAGPVRRRVPALEGPGGAFSSGAGRTRTVGWLLCGIVTGRQRISPLRTFCHRVFLPAGGRTTPLDDVWARSGSRGTGQHDNLWSTPLRPPPRHRGA